MIIDKNSNTTTSTKKSTAQPIESTENIPSGDEPLDEETLFANRQKLMSKKKGELSNYIFVFKIFIWLLKSVADTTISLL